MVTHMKTTIELPDDLLIEAKAVAVRRRTTLKDLITRALRREIMPMTQLPPEDATRYEVGPFGILRLKKRGTPITSEIVQKMQEAADEEDLQHAMKSAGKR
jgi:hypothetical protein